MTFVDITCTRYRKEQIHHFFYSDLNKMVQLSKKVEYIFERGQRREVRAREALHQETIKLPVTFLQKKMALF